MHPFYISLQVLKVLLIKFYKIRPPVLIVLMFYIAFFTSANIIFDNLQNFIQHYYLKKDFCHKISFFNGFTQTYHAKFDQSMVTESYMTKALNGQNSSKQKSQLPSPPFNVFWKNLPQLLLVLLFTPSLLHFKLYKFLLTPLQL